MGDRNIAQIVRRQGRERSGEVAFVAPQRTWTFAEIDAESNRVARGLASLSVGPGDRVGCLTRHMADCARRFHGGQPGDETRGAGRRRTRFRNAAPARA